MRLSKSAIRLLALFLATVCVCSGKPVYAQHTAYEILARTKISSPRIVYMTPQPFITPSPTPNPADANVAPEADVATDETEYLAVLEPAATIPDSTEYINVLVAGVDRRGSSGNSRADVTMILSLDLKHSNVKVTSILRDTLVYVPGKVDGYRKINAASSKGGMNLLMDTINYNFGMNLENYVLLDFEMFEKTIDLMGGITMELTAKEISAANDCIAGLNKQTGYELRDGFITEPAGTVTLTGKQALGYARIRKIDSDFKRTQRQYDVVVTVYNKFMGMSLTEKYALISSVLPMVETNMSSSFIIGAMLKALSIDMTSISYFQIPHAGTYKSGKYNGSYALLTDISANASELGHFLSEE